MSNPFPSRCRCALLATLPVVLLLASACRSPQAPDPGKPDADGHTAPSRHTIEANAAVAKALPLSNRKDFQDAWRNRIAHEEKVEVRDAKGELIWSSADYDFVDGEAPDSVNPSLWRQARLNGIHGLFRVTTGVHQVRGYDLSNMTIIEGETGWIIVDPLTSRQTAAAALALARRHLPPKPIVAVILTHSHVDHFGGIEAVAPRDAEGIRILAPRGFFEEATSENILAGVTMGRRAVYMYGSRLARSPRGHVDSGLGKQPAIGAIGLREPTELIDHTPQEVVIDGVPFVFQYVPESEAPAELTFYLPRQRAFCGAEIVSHTMHNLYTIRGAKVRDALRWSGYIDEAMRLFPEMEVVFASHHWPVWDTDRVRTYLSGQRDLYRYLHDQTLRLAGSGLTPREIAEQLELPESLRKNFANRGYYGTVRHNVKGVYQQYFGWYDANPANLDPLPPEEEGKRYVEAMGGPEAVRKVAARAIEDGDYRWAATILNHLVFARPDDSSTREMLAGVYDQLGYQAESGPWRDAYLTGALELRRGPQASPVSVGNSAPLLRSLPPEKFFQALATRLNGPKAEGLDTVVNFEFTDRNERWVLQLENSVLHARQGDPHPLAIATVRLTQPFFVRLLTRQASLREMIFSTELKVEGSRLGLLWFLQLFELPEETFAIVTP